MVPAKGLRPLPGCRSLIRAVSQIPYAFDLALHVMFPQRRIFTYVAVVTFLFTIVFLTSSRRRQSWRGIPQTVGLGEQYPASNEEDRPSTANAGSDPYQKSGTFDASAWFEEGTTKPLGSNYTRTLVMARMKEEDIDWVSEELPDLNVAAYVADDEHAPLHPPKNKGHEVMIYFSYIIDHYDALPDIMIFMHSHRWSWHNNDLSNNDAVDMLKKLSSERVTREGYFNMRCHWGPGCPDWMHPGNVQEDANKQEEIVLAEVWSELFPHDPIPQVLAQPCCAQFALSVDRVRAIPRSRYIFYRNWLLRTELSDYISGRVWEYLWQVLFTGRESVCPKQNACYCDGYGICFGGEDQFEEWFEVRYRKQEREGWLGEWREKAKAIEDAKSEGRLDEAATLEVPEIDKDVQLEKEIDDLQSELDHRLKTAIERGVQPWNRALEAGREYREGNGY